ncbi:hypothetical protein VTN96DRAFT_1779 [Rasamsonia emersonii]
MVKVLCPPLSPNGHSDLPSPEDPRQALTQSRISSIFRHYVSELAPWYDLNDARRRFQDVVSVEALHNPLLFSAILAFSSVHLHRSLGSREFLYIAEYYHLESIRRLIAITDRRSQIHDGATLAATCLLRSYEILAQSVGSQSHLHGSSSFLAGQQIRIGPDLLSAGFWNYLREDITVALIEKRRLKIDLENIWMQYPTEDDDRANMISLLLGRTINSCFGTGNDARVLPIPEWRSLREQVDEWRRDLPISFEPIHFEQDRSTNNFPELLHFHGWHIAGLQYYHTLQIILLLAELGSVVTAEAGSLKMGSRIMALTPRVAQEIEHHAVQICALAISNDSNAARVNAFGPIAFCGVYIRNQQQRRQLLDELQKWEKLTSWPVESIVRVLQTAWEEDGEAVP